MTRYLDLFMVSHRFELIMTNMDVLMIHIRKLPRYLSRNYLVHNSDNALWVGQPRTMSSVQLECLNLHSGFFHAFNDVLLVMKGDHHIGCCIDIIDRNLSPCSMLSTLVQTIEVPADQSIEVYLSIRTVDVRIDKGAPGVAGDSSLIVGDVEDKWDDIHVSKLLSLVKCSGTLWKCVAGQIDQRRDPSVEVLGRPRLNSQAVEGVGADLPAVRVRDRHDLTSRVDEPIDNLTNVCRIAVQIRVRWPDLIAGWQLRDKLKSASLVIEDTQNEIVT